MAMPKYVCPACALTGNAIVIQKGSRKVEILLWCCLIVPGLIYTLWRQGTTKHYCRTCEVEMISVKGPHGQRLTGA